MYAVESAALTNLRGTVSAFRRNAIREKVRDMFLLAQRD
jgi:hypothetical protein